MPDNTLELTLDATANNEEVIRKQAAQDAAGRSTTLSPEDLNDSMSALDRLAEAQSKEKEVIPEAGAVTPETKTPEEIAAAAKAAEEAAKKAADEAAARTAELAKADETFFKDSPKLPPNASPKSSESFNSIKL